MKRDAAMTQRLRGVIARLESQTRDGQLGWEKQAGSAHRYTQIKNHLVILGPAAPLDSDMPRYLFITPFDSPNHFEVNSNDDELGPAVLSLAKTVEEACKDKPAVDPFAVTDKLLERLESM
ncbi:MAG TPA: hypothetical protein VHQ95_21870 [Pyrinomonadaceae bacterium]|nr:hypothetical protein [Pyrinomonadaceae bacterium]